MKFFSVPFFLGMLATIVIIGVWMVFSWNSPLYFIGLGCIAASSFVSAIANYYEHNNIIKLSGRNK